MDEEKDRSASALLRFILSRLSQSSMGNDISDFLDDFFVSVYWLLCRSRMPVRYDLLRQCVCQTLGLR